MPRPPYLTRTRYLFTVLEIIPLKVCWSLWGWLLAKLGKI